MSTIINGTVVIIAYDWPANTGGGRIATKNTIEQALRKYARVHFIGLVDHPFDQTLFAANKNITCTHIQTVRAAPWKRFLKSLMSRYPAIIMQFLHQKIETQILQIISDYVNKNESLAIIFEDVHPAVLLLHIKKQFPNIPTAIRSENLTVAAFETFCTQGSWLRRLPWCLEVTKIAKFEQEVCSLVDRLWAITNEDAVGYQHRYGIECHGVFGVSLDVERYLQIPSGDPQTLLYIGSTDYRKSKGLRQFINDGWPRVKATIPTAKFLIAGKNTEHFTNEDVGIWGLGYYQDEREFLAKGALFLNPQEDGSGIKLKSIVAMLSGKALVSTTVGIQGLLGKDGRHFLVADNAIALGTLIVELMQNKSRMSELSSSARLMASRQYTQENLWNSVKPLLDDLAISQKFRD